jgi:hypothetical protein
MTDRMQGAKSRMEGVEEGRQSVEEGAVDRRSEGRVMDLF